MRREIPRAFGACIHCVSHSHSEFTVTRHFRRLLSYREGRAVRIDRRGVEHLSGLGHLSISPGGGTYPSLRAGALIHLSGLGYLSIFLSSSVSAWLHPLEPSPWVRPVLSRALWAFWALTAPLRQSPESEPLGPARALASPPGPSGPWPLPSRFAPLSHGFSELSPCLQPWPVTLLHPPQTGLSHTQSLTQERCQAWRASASRYLA